MKYLIFIVIIQIAFLQCFITAQQPPCKGYYTGLTHKTSLVNERLPLSISMPYEIIKSYNYLDSIAKIYKQNEWKNYIDSLDTKHPIFCEYFKNFYSVVDYDPVLFFLSNTVVDTNYKSSSYALSQFLLNKLVELSPEPFRDLVLGYSDVVLHISIKDTMSKYYYVDSWTTIPQHIQIVTCEVIDTIKGKAIPVCKDTRDIMSSNDYNDPVPNYQHNKPGACFQFEYRLEWIRGADSSAPNMIDSANNYWIQKGKEYIVFFRLNSVCHDSADWYYSYFPLGKNSITYTMYPIIDGKVYDPNDEFGFGTSLSADEFKAKLRGRINDILNCKLNLVIEDKKQQTKIENKNYPNPFSERTNIRFFVSNLSSDIELKVFNDLGIEVFKSTIKNYNLGINTISFDASALPSGVYYYSIQTGLSRTTNKMHIVR